MTKKKVLALSATLVLEMMFRLPAQTPRQDSDPVARLESAAWTDRAAAFGALERQPNAFASPRAAAALMRLLKRENAIVTSTLRDSHGAIGVSGTYGEAYGEYYENVFAACLQYCDKTASLALVFQNEESDRSEIRMDAIYMLGQLSRPASRFTAEQRAAMNQRLADDARDKSSFIIREAGLRSIDAVLAADPGLSGPQRAAFHTAVVGAAADSFDDVRVEAVRVLGSFGDTADLSLLRELARSDTSRIRRSTGDTFPVRDAAIKSINKILVPRH